eukprot:GILJ01011305.1.p1 GENE.GILJ01011305.1~~GILJ01011305.1.p1  ORF type:complete len:1240 (-),score=152.36 GILJ01011305.1:102-3821(-)
MSVYTVFYCGRGSVAPQGGQRDVLIPKPVSFPQSDRASDQPLRFAKIASGTSHTLVLTDGGEVWAWGDSSQGQLGLGEHVMSSRQPVPLSYLADVRVNIIACGHAHSAAVSEDGDLYTWGEGGCGRLGTGDQVDYAYPTRLGKLDTVQYIEAACGHQHSAAVGMAGELYTWGRGAFGRLGHGDEQNTLSAKIVTGIQGFPVSKVALGHSHSLAVTREGELYAWGDGGDGRLGHMPDPRTLVTSNVWKPRRVMELAGRTVIAVACGERHSAVVTENGQVFTWGRGDFGRLGHNNHKSVAEPLLLSALADRFITQIACGTTHTAAVDEQGCCYTWGDGAGGALGHNAISDVVKPQPIAVLEKFQQKVLSVSCGEKFTVFICAGPAPQTSNSRREKRLSSNNIQRKSLSSSGTVELAANTQNGLQTDRESDSGGKGHDESMSCESEDDSADELAENVKISESSQYVFYAPDAERGLSGELKERLNMLKSNTLTDPKRLAALEFGDKAALRMGSVQRYTSSSDYFALSTSRALAFPNDATVVSNKVHKSGQLTVPSLDLTRLRPDPEEESSRRQSDAQSNLDSLPRSARTRPQSAHSFGTSQRFHTPTAPMAPAVGSYTPTVAKNYGWARPASAKVYTKKLLEDTPCLGTYEPRYVSDKKTVINVDFRKQTPRTTPLPPDYAKGPGTLLPRSSFADALTFSIAKTPRELAILDKPRLQNPSCIQYNPIDVRSHVPTPRLRKVAGSSSFLSSSASSRPPSYISVPENPNKTVFSFPVAPRFKRSGHAPNLLNRLSKDQMKQIIAKAAMDVQEFLPENKTKKIQVLSIRRREKLDAVKQRKLQLQQEAEIRLEEKKFKSTVEYKQMQHEKILREKIWLAFTVFYKAHVTVSDAIAKRREKVQRELYKLGLVRRLQRFWRRYLTFTIERRMSTEVLKRCRRIAFKWRFTTRLRKKIRSSNLLLRFFRDMTLMGKAEMRMKQFRYRIMGLQSWWRHYMKRIYAQCELVRLRWDRYIWDLFNPKLDFNDKDGGYKRNVKPPLKFRLTRDEQALLNQDAPGFEERTRQESIRDMVRTIRGWWRNSCVVYSNRIKDLLKKNRNMIEQERARMFVYPPKDEVEVKRIQHMKSLSFEQSLSFLAKRLPHAPKMPRLRFVIDLPLLEEKHEQFIAALRRKVRQLLTEKNMTLFAGDHDLVMDMNSPASPKARSASRPPSPPNKRPNSPRKTTTGSAPQLVRRGSSSRSSKLTK